MKENYAIALDRYLLNNVKQGTEHDIDSTYGDIPEIHRRFDENLADDKFESLLRICVIFLCVIKFLTNLDDSSQNTLYWKILE